MRPLEGITVVSLEQAVAAPFASRQLADLGARVIKIERPKVGDFARNYDKSVNGLSSYFVWINRGKESIELDLKDEASQKVLEEIIGSADVFLQNLVPGAVDRLGYAPEKLHEKYPELIICSISGYGTGGPYEQKKAYDLLIQCEAGLLSVTGTDEVPSKAGISIADISAGMYAYSGILTALIAKNRTGKGTILSVSMLEALGEWMGNPMYYAAYSNELPKRNGDSHPTIYPYGSFTCGDEKAVFFGIQNEREWKQFCDHVVEDSSLIDDERFNNNTNRSTNKALLKEIIEDKYKRYTSEEIILKLNEADIANARLNTMLDFYNHPQLKARNRWRTVNTENGAINALLPPVTFNNIDYVMGDVPSIGQHNEQIIGDKLKK